MNFIRFVMSLSFHFGFGWFLSVVKILILNQSYFTLFPHSWTLCLFIYLASEFAKSADLNFPKYYLVMIILSNYVEYYFIVWKESVLRRLMLLGSICFGKHSNFGFAKFRTGMAIELMLRMWQMSDYSTVFALYSYYI